MRHDTNLLSLAAAAAAGALCMYYLDSNRDARRRATIRGSSLHGQADLDQDAGPGLAAHPTPPAPDSWNEQGV